MKATGIVRRIDDLGRVVIPKEIRKTLRIKEGTPLEIFTDREGQIILKKYSPIGELGQFAGEYAESLAQTTGYLVLVTDCDHVIAASGSGKKEFEEKPEHPSSNLASMGIYIFSWKVLRDALIELKDQQSCDFGKHIIPYCFKNNKRLFAYEFNGYWKDVGTLGSYWEANMELIDLIPEFNLYEEFWKIYTKCDTIEPQYIAPGAHVERCIIGEASEIHGEVINSVIGPNVYIGEGTVVRDSIIMKDTSIGKNVTIDKSIIAENCRIEDGVTLGIGEEAPNKLNESVYSFGLVTIGDDSVIPENVSVGKNTAISGVTEREDYPDGILASGEVIIKAGDRK